MYSAEGVKLKQSSSMRYRAFDGQCPSDGLECSRCVSNDRFTTPNYPDGGNESGTLIKMVSVVERVKSAEAAERRHWN